MNLEKLQTKLFAAARKSPPSDHVPFAFEKRIMANLAKPIADAWGAWGHALWRAAAACVIAMAVFGGWTMQSSKTENTDLSQAFESTIFAALDEHAVATSYEDNTW